MQTERGTHALRGMLRRFKQVLLNGPVRRAKTSDSRHDMRPYVAAYEEWQRNNPASPFKDFASQYIEQTLAEEKSHPSLGRNLKDGSDRASRRFFDKLVEYGLREQDTCVDYGCGTLRVGQHVINFLGRGRYWGLDITERLLDEGRLLLKPALMAAKQPNLLVISENSVGAAAAAKPAMLFSHRVMPHVHPAELQEFFANVIKIIGTSGQAIIDGKWSEGETEQYKPGSWAHSAAAIRKLVASLDGQIAILLEKRQDLPGDRPSGMKQCILRVTHGSIANTPGMG